MFGRRSAFAVRPKRVPPVSDLDLLALLVVETHETLDDEGKLVDSMSHSVVPEPSRMRYTPAQWCAPIDGLNDAFGLELPMTRISCSIYGASVSAFVMEPSASTIMWIKAEPATSAVVAGSR